VSWGGGRFSREGGSQTSERMYNEVVEGFFAWEKGTIQQEGVPLEFGALALACVSKMGFLRGEKFSLTRSGRAGSNPARNTKRGKQTEKKRWPTTRKVNIKHACLPFLVVNKTGLLGKPAQGKKDSISRAAGTGPPGIGWSGRTGGTYGPNQKG